MNILAATVTFYYVIASGTVHQACYQKVGVSSPTCQTITTSATTVPDLDDDTDYDFWVKVASVDSAKVRVRTQKKTVLPPAIVIQP
jgi:hypothetical protein